MKTVYIDKSMSLPCQSKEFFAQMDYMIQKYHTLIFFFLGYEYRANFFLFNSILLHLSANTGIIFYFLDIQIFSYDTVYRNE